MKEQVIYENQVIDQVKSFTKDKTKVSEEKSVFEKGEFQARLEQEKKEMRERFKDLIDLVNQRYEQSNLSPLEVADFKQHNENILDYALELGLRKKLDQEEMKILSMATILHDLTKADSPPAELAHISNYVLVAHGQTAAQESKKILSNDYLKKHGFENHTLEDLNKIREQVSQAIAQHMGPHPGFMTDILDGVNKALEKEGRPLIKHPSAQGKIAKTLLAADMLSLASINGRKKVLSIRANNGFFQSLDKQMVAEYQRLGIDLRQGEAALLSGFESAYQAVKMIKNPQDRALLEEVFEESKKEEYQFNQDPEPVKFEKAKEKEEEFKKRSLKEQLT
jgi:hypothetical protein